MGYGESPAKVSVSATVLAFFFYVMAFGLSVAAERRKSTVSSTTLRCSFEHFNLSLQSSTEEAAIKPLMVCSWFMSTGKCALRWDAVLLRVQSKCVHGLGRLCLRVPGHGTSGGNGPHALPLLRRISQAWNFPGVPGHRLRSLLVPACYPALISTRLFTCDE